MDRPLLSLTSAQPAALARSWARAQILWLSKEGAGAALFVLSSLSLSLCGLNGCVLMPWCLCSLSRPRLWVEVVGARNLDSYQSVDAYCVIELLSDELDAPSNSAATALSRTSGALTAAMSSRSPTASSSNQMNPAWNHSVEFALPPTHSLLSMTATPGSGDAKCGTSAEVAAPSFRLQVQVFNEKNFFFDMFPTSGMSNSASSRSFSSSTSSSSSSSPAKSARRPSNRRASWDFCLDGEDDDDVVTNTIDKASEVLKRNSRTSSDLEEKRSQSGGNAQEATDEELGSIEIHGDELVNGDCVTTDRWYRLNNARSGEIRIRTIAYQLQNGMVMNDMAREEIFMKHLYRAPMTDRHGFSIPEKSRKEWAHLCSYQECREERRLEEWTAAFGSKFPAHSLGLKKRALVRQLARDGIPNNWRQDVYMNISGAFEKKNQAEAGYYESLVRQSDSVDSVAFRQIELDIDRTFGHSGTQICTDAGRAMLRRVLRAYSIRNPSVGYCQGLNFIVGFLTLAVDEESAFWLLAVICEDFYPGYYTPTMADTQTDMLVLKELIADELPVLDDYTADVGLPLELLGSQWLLCLFTTTFPSETVFRFFDCIFTEGAHFVFPVIIAHLRRLEPELIHLDDFHAVLSTMKNAENMLFDADDFMTLVNIEVDRIHGKRIDGLREKHRVSVHDEMQRAARARALNRQLEIVYQIPAFPTYAATVLRFFHEEAEVSARSDVAFILTLLCHGLVWLAEHSKQWRK